MMGMKAPTEGDLVRTVLDYLALRHVVAWRANNIPAYDPARKAYRTFHGLKGVADVLGVLPLTFGDLGGNPVRVGVFLAVECKSRSGRLRKEQAAYLDAVRAAGGVALVVKDVRELEAELARLGY
jgi:hypothetical protein